MTAVAAAAIAGGFSLLAAGLAVFGTRLRHDLDKVNRDLDACQRERRQLKQVLQLTVGALVGLLPDKDRDRLLVSVAQALDELDEVP